MWRHLRMMKRGGRSYDPTGVNGTSPGELAVRCPACPIPSVNLPPNWQSVGKDLEYACAAFGFTFPNTVFFFQIPLLPDVWYRRLFSV